MLALGVVWSISYSLCTRYMGDLSEEDVHVWQTLYWPNGTRMNSKQALDVMMNRRPKWDVLNALLDKYNEDHHLFGVCPLPHSLLALLLILSLLIRCMFTMLGFCI